ncbi:MAG: hypothetical protein JWO22_2351 [Frankiales bacterium]|nr:hypothetical protein [Frankiales bacterium]
MRRLLVLVLVAGCVSPSFNDRDYELKAGNTAKAVASSLSTAILGADAARRHKAGEPYLSVLIGNAEKDALAVQSTFDGVQPPNAAADRLKGTVDDLLASATTGLSQMRIACRRGHLDRLPALADGLRSTLDELRFLAEHFQ